MSKIKKSVKKPKQRKTKKIKKKPKKQELGAAYVSLRAERSQKISLSASRQFGFCAFGADGSADD